MHEAPADGVDVNELLVDCLRVAESQIPPGVELKTSCGSVPVFRGRIPTDIALMNPPRTSDAVSCARS